MNKRKLRQLRKLLRELLVGVPRKILWANLRIRAYDLYTLMGSYSDDVLEKNTGLLKERGEK